MWISQEDTSLFFGPLHMFFLLSVHAVALGRSTHVPNWVTEYREFLVGARVSRGCCVIPCAAATIREQRISKWGFSAKKEAQQKVVCLLNCTHRCGALFAVSQAAFRT